MELSSSDPPSTEDLHNFGLGRCSAERALEIESFLASGPDCTAVFAATPDDPVVAHLRGVGALTQATTAGLADDSDETAPLFLADHPRYRVIRKIGQGGMGTVYLAEHQLLRRLVAVKRIRVGQRSSPPMLQRFRHEMEAVARLTHPHIVTAHDADEAAGDPFLVMEYIDGETLAERLARGGPLPVAQACAYVRQAALGLQFAHEQGMVHRDIKPHNLMLSRDGTVKILDFGLARFIRAAQDAVPPAERTVMGTLDYMAPEQALDSESADIRADIYSLGCTLQHLLTGQRPLRRNPPSGGPPAMVPNPSDGVPAPLERVLAKMMANDPAQRYQTPAEVVLALESFLGDRPTQSSPAPGRRLRMVAVALTVLTLCAVSVGVALWLTRPTDGESLPPPPPASTPVVVKPLQELRRLPFPGHRQVRTAFSPDGRTCAAWGAAGFRVWDVESGKVLAEMTGLRQTISAVLLPGGQELMTSHTDGVLRRWDLKRGVTVQQFRTPPSWFTVVDVAPDGAFVHTTKPDVQVWDLKTGAERFCVSGLREQSLLNLSPLSPDGTRLVLVDYLRDAGAELRIVNTQDGAVLRQWSLNVQPHTAGWSADGKEILLNAAEPGNSIVARIDADSGKVLSRVLLTPRPGSSEGRRFSPDGRHFVVLYPSAQFVHLYDLGSGQLIRTALVENTAFSASFSPDGRLLACGKEDEVLIFAMPVAEGALQ